MKLPVPKYAIVPLSGMIFTNMVAYYGTRFFTDHRFHYDFHIKIDEMIPFCSIFVIPYILAYVQWTVGYIRIAKAEKEYCNYIFDSEILAKIVTMVLFIAVPTTINRPAIDNRNIFSVMVQSIYVMDAPTNLFPSIHCLESWICFRGTFCHKSFSGGYKAGMFLMTILVFMSTVLIKQHVIIDIVGAIVVAEISFVTVRKIKGIRIRDR